MKAKKQKTIKMCGTLRYCSARTHFCEEISRRDDMGGDPLELEFCSFVNPSCGDTAFPSVNPVRGEQGAFLVTNYTSCGLPDWVPWIVGQLRHTRIYMTKLRIVPV